MLASTTITEVRKLFYNAINSSENTNKLYNILVKENTANNALLKGYYGATIGLKAKHASNPISKMSLLSEALKIIDEAINDDKSNIELRHLRFAIEGKTPAILGFRKHIVDDKNVIVKGLKNKITREQFDKKHVSIMINDILKQKICTETETALLYKLLE